MAAAPGPAIIFVAIALLLSIPARLRSNPFSIPNAESEIVAGIYTEYNSKPLAVFELVHGLELTAMVGLLGILFLPFTHNPMVSVAIYLLGAVVLVGLTTGLAAATARLKSSEGFQLFLELGSYRSIACSCSRGNLVTKE
jgi:NADH-quinone oxidoreductase subunit H